MEKENGQICKALTKLAVGVILLIAGGKVGKKGMDEFNDGNEKKA